jgi:hypothetical protein
MFWEIQKMLALLVNNWRIVALVIGSWFLFGSGYHYGGEAVQEKWDTTNAKIRNEQIAEQVTKQILADRADKQNSEIIATLNEKANKLSRRLANVTNDSAYRCRPTVDGLQQLNAIITASSPPTAKHNE